MKIFTRKSLTYKFFTQLKLLLIHFQYIYLLFVELRKKMNLYWKQPLFLQQDHAKLYMPLKDARVSEIVEEITKISFVFNA